MIRYVDIVNIFIYIDDNHDISLSIIPIRVIRIIVHLKSINCTKFLNKKN